MSDQGLPERRALVVFGAVAPQGGQTIAANCLYKQRTAILTLVALGEPQLRILEDLLGERHTVTVLRALTSLGRGVSGNDLARRLGLPQTSIRNALERLVARGIVTRVDIGPAASYELDRRREVVRRVLVPLFRAEAALEESLWRTIASAVARLEPPPRVAIIYGSVGRGEATPRDVDLMLVLADRSHEMPLRDQLLDLEARVQERFQVPLSPFFVTATGFQRLEPSLRRRVVSEGVLIFGEPMGPFRTVRRADLQASNRE
jgi:DNA-binding Lrp family transcriptional regulator